MYSKHVIPKLFHWQKRQQIPTVPTYISLAFETLTNAEENNTAVMIAQRLLRYEHLIHSGISIRNSFHMTKQLPCSHCKDFNQIKFPRYLSDVNDCHNTVPVVKITRSSKDINLLVDDVYSVLFHLSTRHKGVFIRQNSPYTPLWNPFAHSCLVNSVLHFCSSINYLCSQHFESISS